MTPNAQPTGRTLPRPAPNKNAGKAPKTARASSPVTAVLVVVLVFLVLLSAGAAALWFNLFDMRPKAIAFLQRLDPAVQQQQSELAVWEKNLAEREDALKEQQKSIDNSTEQQKTKQAKIDKDRQELDQSIAAFEQAQLAATERASSPQGDKIADVYGNLDAKVAAQMLSKAGNIQEVVDVLRRLDAEQAAEILSNMDPKTAYDVTTLLPN